MTLDEAIKHCEEVAEHNEEQARIYDEQAEALAFYSCKECATEHRQLAEWLRELQHLRNLVAYAEDFDCTIRKAEIKLRKAEEFIERIEKAGEEVKADDE